MSLNWTEQFQKMFRVHLPQTPPTILPGVYHYRREEGGNITRFHLRVEDDGSGLLLANASVAARLSPSGVFIAKALLEEKNYDEIRQLVQKNFRSVDKKQLQSDMLRLSQYIATLANPDDNYPIFNLDDPALSVPKNLIAPFHAQLRVAAPERTNPLLEKLWDAGVIHVTFAALRDSDSESAVRNIERAEDLGMISGLRGVASWLQAPDLLRRAAMAGADYVTAPVVSVDAGVHDSFLGAGDFENLRKCLEDCSKWEVCAVIEVPLFQQNAAEVDRLFTHFQVKNILCYAISSEHQPQGFSDVELIQMAVRLKELAETSDVRYIWQPPVSSTADLYKIIEHGPRTAGDISVRVEPDGSVYPARGPFVAGGNILRENLATIWNQDVFLKYRQRVEAITRCEICPGLEICAADCPADPRGWASGDPI